MDKSDSREDFQEDFQEDYQLLKILFFTLSIFFILDCYAISRHFFNLYNIVFMLIAYPSMVFVILKFNNAFLDLVSDTERTVKIEKRFFFLLALIMAFISSTDNFLEYSMISLSSGIINYMIHYFTRFCVIYAIMLFFSKSYKKKL